MDTTTLALDNCLILQGGWRLSPLEYQVGVRIDPFDIIGNTYGQLVVDEYLGCIQKAGTRGNGKTRTLHIHRYKCVCACGGSVEVSRVNLLTNHTRSCGCLKQRRGKASPSWEGHGEISGRFWTHIQHHAASRGIPFDLTIEQAWEQFKAQEGRCALTGWPISAKKHKVGGQYTTRTASLDRIDSSKGYSTDNIQWLHKRVNKSKMEFGQSEFISMCRAVAKRCSDEQCGNNSARPVGADGR